MNFTSAFNGAWHNSLKAGSDTAAATAKGLEAMKAVYEDYYAPLDKEETAALLKFYREKPDLRTIRTLARISRLWTLTSTSMSCSEPLF